MTSPSLVLCWTCVLLLCAATALAQVAPSSTDDSLAAGGSTSALEEDEVWVEKTYAEEWFGQYAALSSQVTEYLKGLARLALIFLPFQLLLPLTRRPWKVRTYEYFLEVLFWLQGMWWGALGLFVIVEVLTSSVIPMGPYWAALGALPYAVQVLLCLVAFDFVVYWRHRAEHTLTPLWAFHAVHHTATKVDWLTTVRLHPFELILGACVNALVVRMGFNREAASLAFFIYLHYNYFIHSNIRLRMPGVLKYIFVTPFMHQWHHARGEETHGKNVGVVFAWNDWLFKTAYHPEAWPTEFGLDVNTNERVGQSYLQMMMYPLRVLWARRTEILWAKNTKVSTDGSLL